MIPMNQNVKCTSSKVGHPGVFRTITYRPMSELFSHRSTESMQCHTSGKSALEHSVVSLVPREHRVVKCIFDTHDSMNTKIFRIPVLANDVPDALPGNVDNFLLFIRQSIPEIESHVCFVKFIGTLSNRWVASGIHKRRYA